MREITKIKLNSDFRRIYYRGRSYVTPLFVLYVFKNRSGAKRVGFSAGKKIGNAVKRNRAKRLLRVAFSENAPLLNGGYDYLLVARARVIHKKSNEVSMALNSLLIENNLVCDD